MNDRIPGATWDNPVWYGKFRIYLANHAGFTYVHDDHDGDESDDRFGYCQTVEACKAEIDERWPDLGKLT